MSGSCIETTEAPEWLSKLESRREKLSKAKLGHDSGAGAACNACGPACPGLDLHFWRKVCRACHCTKDVHDVQDDDIAGWAQFQLLGTARPKKTNYTVMKICGLSDDPVKLDWVPPNTSPDVVSDYMSSLGDTLVPVVGSGGAARRREQLRRQVPLHDISSDLCCHKMTTQEQQEHQDYISHIKNQVVGVGNIVRVGTIQKGNTLSINTEGSQPVPGTKSYTLPLRVSNLGMGIKFTSIPKNTTDKHLVLDNKGNVITKSVHIADYKSSPIISRLVKSKLNIMRIESDRIKSAVEHGPIYDRLFKDLKQLNVSVEGDVYLSPIKKFRNEYNLNPTFKDETTAFVETQGAKIVPPSSLNNNDGNLRGQIIPSNYAQNGTIFGPNGEIWSWSTQVDDHNNPVNPVLVKTINTNYQSSVDSVGANKQRSNPLHPKSIAQNDSEDLDVPPPPPNYDTYPGQLQKPVSLTGATNYLANEPTSPNKNIGFAGNSSDELVQNKMANYPENTNLLHYPDIVNPYADLQISGELVLPDQLTERVAELHVNPMEGFKGQLSQLCHRCNLPIEQGQVAVKAERAGEKAVWHPPCFACIKCNQLLVDLLYFYYQGDVYCARDFADAMKIPRCAGCDELIFSRSYTAAEGQYFHVKHFCCYYCDIPLGGKQYIPDDKSGQPMCLECDSKLFGKKCHSCKNIIAAEQQGVSWSSYHWHGTCFNCSSILCQKSLLSGRFVIKDEKPYCSAACVQNKLRF